jgi:thiol-disulfide isomerase/thioredoxin
MKPTTLRSAVGGSLLLLAVLGCGNFAEKSPQVGGEAPRFSFTAADGSVVSNDTLRGHVVLLTFWSTTCVPCVREIPHLQKLEDAKLARVIGIALDPGGWKVVRPFIEKHRIGYPKQRIGYPIVIGDEEVFQRFEGYHLPHSLLLDRSHRVVKIYRGAVSHEVVERDIKAIGQEG